MITVTNMAAQGDVLFRRVESIPVAAMEQSRSGALVVAHSETGHHHLVASKDAALLTIGNPLVCYLRLDGPFADVVHERSFDTHETLRLLGSAHGPSYFEIRRQREHVPERPRRQHNDEDEDEDAQEWMFAGD